MQAVTVGSEFPVSVVMRAIGTDDYRFAGHPWCQVPRSERARMVMSVVGLHRPGIVAAASAGVAASGVFLDAVSVVTVVDIHQACYALSAEPAAAQSFTAVFDESVRRLGALAPPPAATDERPLLMDLSVDCSTTDSGVPYAVARLADETQVSIRALAGGVVLESWRSKPTAPRFLGSFKLAAAPRSDAVRRYAAFKMALIGCSEYQWSVRLTESVPLELLPLRRHRI